MHIYLDAGEHILCAPYAILNLLLIIASIIIFFNRVIAKNEPLFSLAADDVI